MADYVTLRYFLRLPMIGLCLRSVHQQPPQLTDTVTTKSISGPRDAMSDSFIDEIRTRTPVEKAQEQGGWITEPPNFHSDLRSLEVFDGHNVHLEAKLTPINDPDLVIEWFLNGDPVKKGKHSLPPIISKLCFLFLLAFLRKPFPCFQFFNLLCLDEEVLVALAFFNKIFISGFIW